MVNTIEAAPLTSDGQAILELRIDGTPLDELVARRSGEPSYQGLWCAWLRNDSSPTDPDPADLHYIWQLLDSHADGSVPVLLCPDDMDVWCTVIVAEIHHSDGSVTWRRLGGVAAPIDVQRWKCSGIRDRSIWTAEEVRPYRDELAGLATLDDDDPAWDQWCANHWPEEHLWRMRGYYGPFINDSHNVTWFSGEPFSFDTAQYDACVAEFRTHRH